jgi:hypothetical protein
MRKKLMVAAMLLVFGVVVQGCFGSFGLTRKVYNFNAGCGPKVAQEAVFLVCAILPVYSIAGFVDVVLLNTIEFWTDKNPLAYKVIDQDGKKLTMNFDRERRQMTLTIAQAGQDPVVLTLRAKTDGSLEAVTPQGVYSAVTNEDGRVALSTAGGAVLYANAASLEKIAKN